MSTLLRSLLLCGALLLSVWAGPALAQEAAEEPPVHVISLYRVAPGQHIAFMEWMAAQEAAAAEAGAPADQWFAHMSGDSWDFLHITADLTDEMSDAVDAAAEAKGLPTGPQGAVKFREFISWHTDTEAAGPMTAAELLAAMRGD